MQQKTLTILCLFSFLYVVDSIDLPPYFKKCSKSDPKLNECVMKNIEDNWLKFIDGDNYYHIQKMKPIQVQNLLVKVDDNLNGNLTGYISFLETFKIRFVNLTLDKQHWEIGYTYDKVRVNGTYKVKGKLFGLPISGSGAANVTFYGGDYTYIADYKFNKKGAKEYIEIYKSFLDYENIKLIDFNLKFFGSSIGEILSDVLNKNWQELGRDTTDSVSIAFANILTTILNAFFERVSYDHFFLT